MLDDGLEASEEDGAVLRDPPAGEVPLQRALVATDRGRESVLRPARPIEDVAKVRSSALLVGRRRRRDELVGELELIRVDTA